MCRYAWYNLVHIVPTTWYISVWFSIPICIARYGWYVLVRQVTGTRTARYRALSPKSIIDGRLREKKGRRKRGKEERRKKRRRRKNTSRRPRPPAVAAGDLRVAAALARGSPVSRRSLVIFLPRGEKDRGDVVALARDFSPVQGERSRR
ncbi:hypothetical protein GW17_00056576, partial [Ensete ventricosum]